VSAIIQATSSSAAPATLAMKIKQEDPDTEKGKKKVIINLQPVVLDEEVSDE
jgi:hypothetical protein